MEYKKQNFISGQILKADHMNYIENGLEEAATEINNINEALSNIEVSGGSNDYDITITTTYELNVARQPMIPSDRALFIDFVNWLKTQTGVCRLHVYYDGCHSMHVFEGGTDLSTEAIMFNMTRPSGVSNDRSINNNYSIRFNSSNDSTEENWISGAQTISYDLDHLSDNYISKTSITFGYVSPIILQGIENGSRSINVNYADYKAECLKVGKFVPIILMCGQSSNNGWYTVTLQPIIQNSKLVGFGGTGVQAERSDNSPTIIHNWTARNIEISSVDELPDSGSFTLVHAENKQILTIYNTVEYTPTTDYHPATKKYVDDAVSNIDLSGIDLSGKEDVSNKTTVLDENSTDEQYPSAKTVFDALSNAGGGEEIKYYESKIDFYSMGVNTTVNLSSTEPLYKAIIDNAEETNTEFILKPFRCKSSGTGASYPTLYFEPISYHHRGSKFTQNTFTYIARHIGYTIRLTSQPGGMGAYIRKYIETSSDTNVEYTPTKDYHPATKKYVDDALLNVGGGSVDLTNYPTKEEARNYGEFAYFNVGNVDINDNRSVSIPWSNYKTFCLKVGKFVPIVLYESRISSVASVSILVLPVLNTNNALTGFAGSSMNIPHSANMQIEIIHCSLSGYNYADIDSLPDSGNLSLSCTVSKVLNTNNTQEYNPEANSYNPATTKYVDEAIANIGGGSDSGGDSDKHYYISLTNKYTANFNQQPLTTDDRILFMNFVTWLKEQTGTCYLHVNYQGCHDVRVYEGGTDLTAGNTPDPATGYKTFMSLRMMRPNTNQADSTTIDSHEFQISYTSNTTANNWYRGGQTKSRISGYDTNSFLSKTNTSPWTPSGDYNPATKKYVDDAISEAIGDVLGGSY